MSFTDMMSSGRGPGVIGLCMALFILIGFGLLFTFAFDEGMQGGTSIESVVRQQGKELESLTRSVESGRGQLESAPERKKNSQDLERLNRASALSVQNIDSLKEKVESGKKDIEAQIAEFEDYKNKYRTFARSNARGTEMKVLETTDGVVYNNVNIREVSAIGIQIRHDGGQKRIPFEELPDSMKDHFQFDPNQKEEALAAESAHREEHNAAVDAAHARLQEEQAQQREINRAAEKAKLLETIALKEDQLRTARSDLRRLQNDLDRDKQNASAARNAGRMYVGKSGIIQGNINSSRNRINALQSEIARLRSQQ